MTSRTYTVYERESDSRVRSITVDAATLEELAAAILQAGMIPTYIHEHDDAPVSVGEATARLRKKWMGE
jgi:hypothetical protein